MRQAHGGYGKERVGLHTMSPLQSQDPMEEREGQPQGQHHAPEHGRTPEEGPEGHGGAAQGTGASASEADAQGAEGEEGEARII